MKIVKIRNNRLVLIWKVKIENSHSRIEWNTDERWSERIISNIFLVLPQSFIYDHDTNRFSLTIMNGSLQINQTYEFYVEMYNYQGLVDKSDAVLIQIQSKNALVVEIS